MIKPGDIIPAFLDGCLGLERPWQEHLAYWGPETDRGLFNDLAVVAQYAVDRYEASDERALGVLFGLVERLLAEGNEDVQGLVSVGILETTQTLAAHRSYSTAVFERWLQPRTRRIWVELDAMWAGTPRPPARPSVGDREPVDPESPDRSGLEGILQKLYKD